MSARFFLDTNVLVYLFDRSAPEKSSRAQALVDEALEGRLGLTSAQVMQEFINVATRKFKVVPSTAEVGHILRDLLEPLCTVFASFELVETAVAVRDETGFAFYDALIVAGAVIGGAAVLYSEDLQHGRVVRGVTIQNPFLHPD